MTKNHDPIASALNWQAQRDAESAGDAPIASIVRRASTRRSTTHLLRSGALVAAVAVAVAVGQQVASVASGGAAPAAPSTGGTPNGAVSQGVHPTENTLIISIDDTRSLVGIAIAHSDPVAHELTIVGVPLTATVSSVQCDGSEATGMSFFGTDHSLAEVAEGFAGEPTLVRAACLTKAIESDTGIFMHHVITIPADGWMGYGAQLDGPTVCLAPGDDDAGGDAPQAGSPLTLTGEGLTAAIAAPATSASPQAGAELHAHVIARLVSSMALSDNLELVDSRSMVSVEDPIDVLIRLEFFDPFGEGSSTARFIASSPGALADDQSLWTAIQESETPLPGTSLAEADAACAES